MRRTTRYALRYVGAFLALAVPFAPAANAATVSPASILSSPTTYDGQHVDVAGTVSALEEKASHRGNDYDVFDLCAGSCVRVFTWGHPPITEGQRLTVHGTFRVTTRVGRYTFRNEIETDEGSL